MNQKTKIFLLFVLDVVVNSAVIILLVIIIRTFIFSPFQVHGPSMCNTFNYMDDQCLHGNGEYLMINKFGYQNFFGWQVGLPERGDVIVFEEPNGDDFYIKRVIGTPGDTLEFKDGYVYINGELLDESGYLNESNLGHTDPNSSTQTYFEVPEGEYFVMGDNRKASSDSRRCFDPVGCLNSSPYITLDSIAGKGWFVMWPFDRIRLVVNGSDAYEADEVTTD